MITNDELRINHEFVTAFETLRKRYGHREMHDDALRDVADATGVSFGKLRMARQLRNAMAHGEPVNRAYLLRQHQILTKAAREQSETRAPVRAASVSSDVSAYRIHAWLDPQLEDEMLANGFVSMGGDEIGDLTAVGDPEIIRSLLTEAVPERPARAIPLFVGYWRRFLWEATAGDLVVLPTQRHDVAIGEFVGPYHYVSDVKARARHRRAVSWNAVGVERGAFGADLLATLNGRHTIQEFKAADAVRRLRALADTGIDPGVAA
ncbi:MAG TPA: hypothetical protein VM282_27505 [Acidimicrobiales bacterium]|nr:hypothetical protein [Acidimicrobiales bacterium]